MNKLDYLLNANLERPLSEKILGITLDNAKDGFSICKWTVGQEHMNGANTLLGGFVTAAADIGMAYAIMSVIRPEDNFTTVSINTTFHRPGKIGEITVESRVKRQGKTMIYVVTELMSDGHLIADATSTCMLLHQP